MCSARAPGRATRGTRVARPVAWPLGFRQRVGRRAAGGWRGLLARGRPRRAARRLGRVARSLICGLSGGALSAPPSGMGPPSMAGLLVLIRAKRAAPSARASGRRARLWAMLRGGTPRPRGSAHASGLGTRRPLCPPTRPPASMPGGSPRIRTNRFLVFTYVSPLFTPRPVSAPAPWGP